MEVIVPLARDPTATNPYQHLLYGCLARQGVAIERYSTRKVLARRYDIWHVHWPEVVLQNPVWIKALLRVLELLVAMGVARLHRTKIVWTVHNLHPHETYHPRLARLFMEVFTRTLNGYLSLSCDAQRLARAAYPALRSIPGFVVPHGHYRASYPGNVDREDARRTLELPPDATVILSFGAIRPYKNIPTLIRAFQRLDRKNVRLVVAGHPRDATLHAQISAAAAADARIRLVAEFIPEAQVPLFFRAADLAVAPFTEILNSGSALLALSFDTPVLAPRQGSLPELQDLVGPEWLHLYDGPFSSAILQKALDRIQHQPPERCSGLDGLDWDEIARQTLLAYRAVAAST